jgi:hypothetical protein
MLNFLSNNLRCSFCNESLLYFEPSETLNFYFVPETFVLSEIKDIIDKSINEYLVFKCRGCGAIIKYTFRDLEKRIRELLYENIINMISIKELRDSNLNTVKKIFVYCGKCPGFDGKGSCPVETYNKCELKRLPSEL